MPYLYLREDGSASQSQDPPNEEDELNMWRGTLRCFALVGAIFTEIKPEPNWHSSFKWEDVEIRT